MDETRQDSEIQLSVTIEEIINDYRHAYRSRQASLIGRREVMSGKAKFGIFGDGKEIAQLAMAHTFQKGDFRSGYYRDQTLMFALGELTYEAFFAQLYAHADLQADPATAGRSMNVHFATRSLDPQGNWKHLTDMYNSSADISPTAAQMPRLVGLAYASRLYRELEELKHLTQFSNKGNEVAFGTIGNAACAEGMFWEALNAIGVLESPTVITIYDDGYGISVSNKFAMIKQNISELVKGFQRESETDNGYNIYTVPGWDYPALIRTYQKAVSITRQEHIPAIIHVTELTQPQGHSTSGSHERYKDKQRLEWEEAYDGLERMRQWMIDTKITSEEELEVWEDEDCNKIEEVRKRACSAYRLPILSERQSIAKLIENIGLESAQTTKLREIKDILLAIPNPLRRDINAAILSVLTITRFEDNPIKQSLINYKERLEKDGTERYSSYLYSPNADSALKVLEIQPTYTESSPLVNGFEILNACFDSALERDPRVIAFGQDVGKLGGVNQGFRGLQEKYGALRVSDTGIREATIIGQAIGLALRGLRPIAEIQYLDYLLYALQIISDDLATLLWRTKGGQKAPVIVRTRGHRLEGIWHSGSLMAGIIHLVRGMHVLVPRNMTQAAGFYNTLLASEEPGIIVEVLNGYRLKEKLPRNIAEFTLPVGIPEVIREGKDITLVTYGATCRIVLNAADLLSQVGIDAEVIDVQSLLPFDINHLILESLKKTGRIVFIDEDVPGGTTAYMLQEVIEKQGGFYWLDSEPKTISGQAHRPAYGSDGDYWSKPNAEQIFETVYKSMHEADPENYPQFF
jgi:pyruvate/2-oxoglutarate/acetoin dehydrogenase E1 component/TPP-dependent pyruvate/acetoin dehydrogenase alpha subunit